MNNDELYYANMKIIIQKELEAGHYKSLGLHGNIQENDLYRCLCCEINLNGISVAGQHAAGKRHLKQVKVVATPVESLTSQLSKWSTSKPIQSSSSSNSSCSRDESLERSGYSQDNNMDISVEESLKRSILKQEENSYSCTPCNLSLNSYSSAKQHIEGTKHGKMLKNGLYNLDSSFTNLLTSSSDQQIAVSHSTHNKVKESEDCPFYCQVCDKALNSESQFVAHNSGIAHNKKLTQISSLGQSNDVSKKENIKTVLDTSSRTKFEDDIIIISAYENLRNHACFLD